MEIPSGLRKLHETCGLPRPRPEWADIGNDTDIDIAVCETLLEELPSVEEERAECRIEFADVCREGEEEERCNAVPRRVCVLATESVAKVGLAQSWEF